MIAWLRRGDGNITSTSNSEGQWLDLLIAALEYEIGKHDTIMTLGPAIY